MSHKITIHWVKGHQNPGKKNLSWPAQLNIKCDELAKHHLQTRRPARSPTYYPTPSHPAILYINKSPVLSKEKLALRRAATTQNLREYLKTKNMWSDKAIESIDWEIYSITLAKYRQADKRRLQKYFHDWLPTNKRLHREDPHRTDKCPTCKQHIEDTQHVLECNHNKRTDLKKKLIIQLNEFCHRTNTPSAIHNLLIRAIDTTVIDKIVQPTKEHNTLQKQLILAQNQIGWENVSKGRLTYHWRQTVDSRNKQDPKKWTSKLIQIMWNHFLLVWKSRNEDQHNVTEARNSEAERTLLLTKIEHLLHNKNTIIEIDRSNLFAVPIEKLKTYTTNNLRHWYQVTKNTFDNLIKIEETLHLQKQPDIRGYFTITKPRQDASTKKPP